jgi:hypothetical protein
VGRPDPPTFAFATCAAQPRDWDDDDHLVALTGATWHDWDDPEVDWDAFDLVVVRSTWDYTRRLEDFRRWARSVPRLVNPPSVLEWNTDKRYLAEAQAAGLPIVPTRFVAPGEPWEPPPAPRFVVKPAVSVGAQDTLVLRAGEAGRAAALVASIHASGRVAMVQPHVASVDERGERGLFFFGGAFSHAIGKGAVLEPGADVQHDLGMRQEAWPADATAAELELAERSVTWLGERFGTAPAYARVDLVLGEDGEPQVLELELTEPCLFFRHAPDGAEERFAEVLTRSAAARA